MEPLDLIEKFMNDYHEVVPSANRIVIVIENQVSDVQEEEEDTYEIIQVFSKIENKYELAGFLEASIIQDVLVP